MPDAAQWTCPHPIHAHHVAQRTPSDSWPSSCKCLPSTLGHSAFPIFSNHLQACSHSPDFQGLLLLAPIIQSISPPLHSVTPHFGHCRNVNPALPHPQHLNQCQSLRCFLWPNSARVPPSPSAPSLDCASYTWSGSLRPDAAGSATSCD